MFQAGLKAAVVTWLNHQGKLPGPAGVPDQRHDSLRGPPRLWLQHQSAVFAEHRQIAGSRLPTQHESTHSPSL